MSIHLRGIVFITLLALVARSPAQSSLEHAQEQFGRSRDSLLLANMRAQAVQSGLLASMRSNHCDTSTVWPLAERCMQLRITLREPLDSLMALNALQGARNPHKALFADLSAMDEGVRIHARLSRSLAELLLLCPDTECRALVEARREVLFRGEAPDAWGLRSFYALQAFALEPVLLKYTAELEQAVGEVLHGLVRYCP
jgi:hypothetical protein